MRRWRFAGGTAALLLLLGWLGPHSDATAQSPPISAAISDGVVKIGLILDMTGPYAGVSGVGSAAAAKMAVEDFGGRVLGAPIEVLVADHHNNTDRAADIARDWFRNQHVDAIMDVSGSSEALIVQAIANTAHKIVSVSAAGAARLSNEACTATSIHYVFNTQAIANTVGAALVARGALDWFFITADYSFGYDLENNTAAVVEQKGGKVIGRARHPINTQDFSSYLSRAQQSKAQVIGLADAGSDLDRLIRQAAQRGMIPGSQTLAALAMSITGIHSLGLGTTQGMMLAESFYWDADDATRAWSKRYFERVHDVPNSLQAGAYSSTMHYLKAVASAGTDETDAVLRVMRATPVDDFFAHNGHIRADGIMVHDMHLYQVKAPAESRYPWDYYKLAATIPGEQAFGSLAQSKCPLVKQ
ncbi:MAG TPA: ABC transporter substrate-binding protein [Stellaceae bacterium]|nr:ABC transporter substrate-binding protein [Stellaceae bacterium]